MVSDSQALQAAGCFSIVLEKIPSVLARKISETIDIPTIGIGAGPYCDGQILVLHDMLGLFEDFKPKFAKQYTNLAQQMRNAVQNYRDEVKKGIFPDKMHSFD
jgi:3-methyl-2-oxobutanoate hydroxymethyltransferase